MLSAAPWDELASHGSMELPAVSEGHVLKSRELDEKGGLGGYRQKIKEGCGRNVSYAGNGECRGGRKKRKPSGLPAEFGISNTHQVLRHRVSFEPSDYTLCLISTQDIIPFLFISYF